MIKFGTILKEPITIDDRNLNSLYLAVAIVAIGGILFLCFYPCFYVFKMGAVVLLIIGTPYLRKGLRVQRYFKKLKELKVFNLLPFKVPVKKDNLYIGKGFMWDNRQTQMMQDLARDGIKTYLPENNDLGGRSVLHNVGSDVEEDLFLSVPGFTSHLSLIGETRVGKTRFLEVLLSQIIERGDSLIVMDPKGEDRLLNFCYSQAIESGREKDFIIFCPPFPQASKTYNPIADYVSVTDIADRIVALLPQGGESQAFTNFCHSIILAVAEGLDAIGEVITFDKIERYSFSPEAASDLLVKVIKTFLREKFKKEYPKEVEDPTPWIDHYYEVLRKAEEEMGEPAPRSKACENLIKFYRHPRENFMKMANELGPLLVMFNSGENRRLLSHIPSDINWQQMLDKDHKIIYFYLGSLIGLKTAYSIGQIALQDLISYIGRRYVYSTERNPVWLVVDEFHNLCYPGFVDLISKAGGAGLRVIISMQSLADLEANMRWNARAHAQQILDNTATKICMRVSDRYTADRFTSIMGRVEVGATSESVYVTPEVDDSKEVFDTSFRTTSRQMEVPLIRSNWINEIPKGHAFMYSGGQTYKVKFPLFPEPKRDFFKELNLR